MSPYQSAPNRSGVPDLAGRFFDFSGGYVDVPDVVGISKLKENQLQKAQNIDIGGGTLRKVKGFTKLTTSGGSGDVSTLRWDKQTGNSYCAYGSKLGYVNGTAITQLTGASGYTNNAIWDMCRQDDYLFWCNGVDAPQLWNTATSTLSGVTSPPATWTVGSYPGICASWMGRIFAAGGSLKPTDMLHYCQLYTPTNWVADTTASGPGAIRIGNDGRPIKALYPLDGGLLIIKDKGLYVLQGAFTYSGGANNFDQTKFDWDLHTNEVDAVSNTALVCVGRTIYVWGRSEVFALTPDLYVNKFTVKVISKNIAASIKNVVNFQSSICAVPYKLRNQIWFSVAANSGSSGIDTVWVYNYGETDEDGNVNEQGKGGWTYRNGYSHKSMCLARDSTGADLIISGGYAANPYIYQQNQGTDYDGTPIECIAWTSYIPLGAGTQSKIGKCFFYLSTVTNQPIQYSYSYDYNGAAYASDVLVPDALTSNWNTSGASTWGATAGKGTTGTWTAGDSYIKPIPVFGKGRSLQHRFYSKMLGADFDILEFEYGTTLIGYA